MTNKEIEILESMGWNIDCESPLNISHSDGSSATGQAAIYTVHALLDENTIREYEELMEVVNKVKLYKEIIKSSNE